MIQCSDLGCIPYGEALDWQKLLADQRRKKEIPDRLLLLEHPPVYTLGKRDSRADILVGEEWLQRQGMQIFKTDRGGRVTYHGPGQLIAYLIFALTLSIPQLVWRIEETLIKLLKHYQIEGIRDTDHPGIWIEDRKIAAVGLRIEKGVTRHGFSLNVNCDLTPFRYIHPCGIQDRGVTSLEKELGWHPPMRDVKQFLLTELSNVFETRISVEGALEQQPE